MDRKKLVTALKKVEPALGALSPNTAPVLASFCFSGTNVHAFNGLIALVYPCETEFTGAVPGRIFLDSLALSKAETVALTQNGETLTAVAGRGKLESPLIDKGEFKFLTPNLKTAKPLKVDEKWLAALSLAAAGMTRKLALAWQYGVTLDVFEKGCIFYATDNRTITRVATGTPQGKAEFSVILLPEFVDALLNAAKESAPKGIYFSPKWVQAFFTGGLKLFSITMEGASSAEYQKITGVYLTKAGDKPPIPPLLSGALQRANLAFGHATDDAHTLLTVKGNHLQLKTPSPVGEITDVIKMPHSDISLKVRPDDMLRALPYCKAITLFEEAVRFSGPGYLFLVSKVIV